MKRSEIMIWLMFAGSVAFPALSGLAALFGYALRVGSGTIYALAATALYIFCAACLLRKRDRRVGAAAMAALSVTLLLDQLQLLFFIFYTFDGSSIPAMLLLALWFWVTVPVAAVYVKPAALKAVFYTLSGLMVLPLWLCILLCGFRSAAVGASAVSPDGTWCAEVIEHNEGALGGSRRVSVYRYADSFSIGSFDFRKGQAEVWRGGWGTDHELYWVDDTHLMYDRSIITVPAA